MGPTRHAAFARLTALAAWPAGHGIMPLHAADAWRAERYTAAFGDLTLDYSKIRIDDSARDAPIARCRALRGEA